MKNRKTIFAKAAKRGGTAAVKGPGCAGEIGGILLALLVLGLLISLASYAETDPPNGTGPEVKNLCGKVGAHLAHGLMFTTGYASYLVLAWIAMAAYRRFQPAPLFEALLEAAGFVLGILGLALLLSRFNPMAGGFLGDYLAAQSGRWLGNWGSILLALGGLLCALVLTTRFSVRQVAALAGSGAFLVGRRMADAGGDVLKGVREHWDDRRDRLEDQPGEKLKPRITDPAGRGKGRAKDADGKPGRGKGAAPDDDKIATFPKPTPPKIQRPEPAPTVEAGGGKVISLTDKRKEQAAARAAAPPAPPEGREGLAAGTAMGDGYDPAAYKLPTLDLLDDPPPTIAAVGEDEMQAVAAKLVQTLKEFGIETKCENIIPGPVVTLYELTPAPGTAVNKFTTREADLKLALAAKSIRIVAPIPGKSAVGIEVPNPHRQIITFKEIALTRKYQESPVLLKVILGKDIIGTPHYLELDKMPHLLIGGQTGSGKTVGIHVLINSLLFAAAPHQLKFVLIDPKMVELRVYKDLPHLLTPVITDAKEATKALKWLCQEMDSRYETLAAAPAQNITRYNEKMRESGKPVMPYVVIIIDELADLMAVGAQECEGYIHRLTAKARAVGIHLVLATQRPSVDVITGLIKANLPARIAFAVIARVDSRTILDANGAENLLGQGDMLFQDPSAPTAVRMQCAYLKEKEIERVAAFVKEQGRPVFVQESFRGGESGEEEGHDLTDEDREYLDETRRIILKYQRGSTSLLQRLLKVAHPRAVRLMEQLEREGLVGPVEGPKPRRVLVTYESYYGEPPEGVADDVDAMLDENERDGEKDEP